jgi:hypothetical protein
VYLFPYNGVYKLALSIPWWVFKFLLQSIIVHFHFGIVFSLTLGEVVSSKSKPRKSNYLFQMYAEESRRAPDRNSSALKLTLTAKVLYREEKISLNIDIALRIP